MAWVIRVVFFCFFLVKVVVVMEVLMFLFIVIRMVFVFLSGSLFMLSLLEVFSLMVWVSLFFSKFIGLGCLFILMILWLFFISCSLRVVLKLLRLIMINFIIEY